MFLKRYVSDLLHLAFPELCCICRKEEIIGSDGLCDSCIKDLPWTLHNLIKENELVDRLRFQVDLEMGGALFYYHNEGPVKTLLHQLKYKRNRELGLSLGRLLGSRFSSSPHFEKPDLLVPVPIHKKRLRERGYNQSLLLCQGFIESCDIPIETNAILKRTYQKSQTKNSREQRLKHLESSFRLNPRCDLSRKHILIIDDVLTTGSTVKAIYESLKDVNALKLSVLTVALSKS